MVKRNLQQGVTLVEMLIVVGIFAVVAAILLFNFSSFSTNVTARNLAQDVALSIRKAQTYATSVNKVALNLTTDQYPAYGATFSIAPVTTSSTTNYPPTRKKFLIFADISTTGSNSPNNLYDYNSSTSVTCGTIINTTYTGPGGGVANECVESLVISSSDQITEICADTDCYKLSSTGAVQFCAGTTCTNTTNARPDINIVFKRPSPEPTFCFVERVGSVYQCKNKVYSSVKITVTSAKGAKRLVEIWNTGQISIN
jgi:prepilin-type N-terminal cleavage/methylation domain-containing protein